MMKWLLKIINDYLLYEKAWLEFVTLTNRRRKLSKTDLMKIANAYAKLGYTLDFLDEPEIDRNGINIE